MKVYIATDSEGQACITREKDEHTVYGTWQADYIRKRATEETAAAVEGARRAGADEILVHDIGFIRGASPVGLVLHYDDLPRGIHIALGGAPMHQVVDSSFDAAILLGHHAMAGAEQGVMAHTFSALQIENIWLNGRRIGEIAIEALWLGAFGIPVVMVSADEDGCREARDWLGDVETSPTKRGLGTHRTVSLHPADACDLIRARAAAALARLDDFAPFAPPPPYELRFDCHTEEQARNRCEKLAGRAEMAGPRSFLLKGERPLDLVW